MRLRAGASLSSLLAPLSSSLLPADLTRTSPGDQQSPLACAAGMFGPLAGLQRRLLLVDESLCRAFHFVRLSTLGCTHLQSLELLADSLPRCVTLSIARNASPSLSRRMFRVETALVRLPLAAANELAPAGGAACAGGVSCRRCRLCKRFLAASLAAPANVLSRGRKRLHRPQGAHLHQSPRAAAVRSRRRVLRGRHADRPL